MSLAETTNNVPPRQGPVVVEQYAERLLKEPEMKTALTAMKELSARNAGKLERIDKNTRRRKPTSA
jgi:hypothetical protein